MNRSLKFLFIVHSASAFSLVRKPGYYTRQIGFNTRADRGYIGSVKKFDAVFDRIKNSVDDLPHLLLLAQKRAVTLVRRRPRILLRPPLPAVTCKAEPASRDFARLMTIHTFQSFSLFHHDSTGQNIELKHLIVRGTATAIAQTCSPFPFVSSPG